MASFSLSRNSSLSSYIGKSILLKQVLFFGERGKQKRKGEFYESIPSQKKTLARHYLLRSWVEANSQSNSVDGEFSNVAIVSLQHTESSRWHS